jgi:hypothetical protein
MHESSDSAKKDEQLAGQPTRPKWRSLTWWLGQTPEQIAEINEEGLRLQRLPLWVRIIIICCCLAAAAIVIGRVGWFVVIPTLGILVIVGVHYLITGKMMKAPLPIWAVIAFWALIGLTAYLKVAGW